MDHAVQRVAVCLKSQDPPLDAWQPDAEYVEKHLVHLPGQAGEDVALDGLKVKTWILSFKESPNWEQMVQRNQAAQRRIFAAERQTTAGWGLAGLTALFLTGWGYFRLDDWTKGRMSKWLAIGAVALLGATGGAWWFGG
jgi:hypothetical protein